ncbi:MAG: MFS transporter [Gaiellaceae bacterium]
MQRSLAGLIVANAVSLTGNVVAIVAIPWLVLTTTGSPARTGIAAFCTTLPLGVGALFGGAIVDRFGARPTSIACDLAAGLAFAAIPLLHLLGVLRFWHVLALAVAGSALDGPAQGARQALLPELRERASVSAERANAFWTTTEHTGYVLGAPLAGVLVASFGAPTALWVDAASFGVSALTIALVVPRTTTRGAGAVDPLGGLRLIAHDSALRSFLVVWTLGNFLIAPLAAVWLPVYARERLGGAGALGVLVTAYGVGGIAGAAGYALLVRSFTRRQLFTAIRILYPIVCAFLVLLPSLAGAAVVLFLIGLVPGTGVPLYQLVLQERTPAELRGRVFSAFTASLTLTAPLAMVGGGILVQAAGLRTSFAIYAATSAVLSAWAWRTVARLL